MTAAGVDCSIAQSVKVNLAEHYFNQVILGAIGGDIYRATVLKLDRHSDRADVVVSVIINRFIGMCTTMVLVPLAPQKTSV